MHARMHARTMHTGTHARSMPPAAFAPPLPSASPLPPHAALAAVVNDKDMPRYPTGPKQHGLLIPDDRETLTAINYTMDMS